MELDTINKLFLELSQVATASPGKEIALQKRVSELEEDLMTSGMVKNLCLKAQAERAHIRSVLDELLNTAAVISPPDLDPCFVNLQCCSTAYEAAYRAIVKSNAPSELTASQRNETEG